MTYTTLISPAELRALTDPLILDCSFDLADPAAGERAYAEGHIPGAHYLHLDRDLCGDKTGPDGTFRGRHPLPERETFAATSGATVTEPATVFPAAAGGAAATAAAFGSACPAATARWRTSSRMVRTCVASSEPGGNSAASVSQYL